MSPSPASPATPSSCAAPAARLPPVRPVRVTLHADALGDHHDASCIGCGAPRPQTQLKLVGPWRLSGPATLLVLLVGLPVAIVGYLLLWLFSAASLYDVTRWPIELCIVGCGALSAGMVGVPFALLFRKAGGPPLVLTVGRCRSCRREAAGVGTALMGTALLALLAPVVLGVVLADAGASPEVISLGSVLATAMSLALLVWRRALVFRQGLHTARLYGQADQAVVMGSPRLALGLARAFPWAVEKVELLDWRWRPMDPSTQRALERPLL